jgi:predicted RNase H-like nuclease (RuvC/YqgF family)
MKTTKRYKDESEILELIDQYHAEIKKLGVKVEKDNTLAHALRGTSEHHRIEGLNERVLRFEKQISWRNGRLETLKDRLAEMRTMTLPGVDAGDGSVASV